MASATWSVWAKNSTLMTMAQDWTARAERQFRLTGEPQRIFGSFGYAAGTWDRSRRVIVKGDGHNDLGSPPAIHCDQ